ncbi:MAG: efflux RND transporter permease subunit [SAR324 cluster bacterium]|nr:efflux RND transporter permease subunit [SAR324 cluster bacterium]
MANLRLRIDTAFETYTRVILRNRYKTLLLMALLIAGLLWAGLPRVVFDASTEAFFHKTDPALITYEAFREQFGQDELVVVAVGPAEVFDRVFLENLRELHGALEDGVPYLKEVTSLINVRDTRGEGDRLIVEDLLETLPETEQAMADLKARVLSSALYPNLFISEDGRFTTIVIESISYSPKGEQGDLMAGFKDDGQEAAAPAKRINITDDEMREVVVAVRKISARFSGEGFPIHIVGTPVWGEYLLRTMPKDMGRFLGLAVIIIAAFLLVLFRRISGMVLPMLVVVLSLLSTVSLMGISGTPLTIPTTILPSFLLAVGVGASVHILAIFYRDFQRSGDKEAALVYTLGHSGLPIVMTGLTTAAGLFAFTTADLAPVAHLGVFGGIGVLLGLAYTLILIPALLAVWPVRRQARLGSGKHAGGFDRLLGGIAQFATSRAWPVVIVSTLLVAFAAAGLPRLLFSHQPTRWIPKSSQLRQDLILVDRELKGSNSVEVVVDTGKENGLYEPTVMKNLEALAKFAQQHRNQRGEIFVGKTQSVADVLKEINKALNENRQEFYTIPSDRQLIAQELLLFENSGSDDLERLVDSQFSKARISVKVRDNDAAAYVGFVQAVQREAERLFAGSAEVTVTGILRLFTGVISNMMRSMVQSYSIAVVVISVMMMLLLASIRIGLLSMIPNLAPILITLGMMGWTGIHLDAFTLLIGSIALGLSVDDTIHFFHNFRRHFVETGSAAEAVRETMLSTGRAMLFTSLVLVTGFWVLMFATLNNIILFGFLTGTTLILALLADFLLAPAMMELIIRTGRGRRIAMRWGAGGGNPA